MRGFPHKTRRTENLRHGRFSEPGAHYFLTWCTSKRAPILARDSILATMRSAFAALDPSGDGTVLAATVMPDHAHLLVELGYRLSVSQVVGKVKSSASRAHPAIEWQENFFERRLRVSDSREDYAFYIFMNPYCAGLCRVDQKWPGWQRAEAVRWGFEDQLLEGEPPPSEWIPRAERFGAMLAAGAR